MHASVKNRRYGHSPLRMTAALFLGCLLLGTMSEALADQEQEARQATPAKQRVFLTPEAAVDALLTAFKNDDDSALLDIFGHEHEKLIVVTDRVARREALTELCQAAQEMQKLEEQGANKRLLVLGKKAWPFPIPLVKEKNGWRFDTAAGADEILNRRIGENELHVIEVCRAYVSAQVEYARQDRDADEVLEYAQRIGSTPGKRDGLYWEVDPDSGEELSPLGPLVADASAYLEARAKAKTRIPYSGYYYQVLTRQGENPPGGKYDYVINGNMIAGFALVAWPADYGSSGIMTFVVSHQGKIYEKDLGEKTGEIASAMQEYDPDKTWKLAKPDYCHFCFQPFVQRPVACKSRRRTRVTPCRKNWNAPASARLAAML